MSVRFAFLASLLASLVFAAPPAPIGIVTASGHFTVEGSRIWGNATLFDGAVVETADASSQLALRGGVKVQLAANSAARVWRDRMILDRGAGQVSSGADFTVRAGGMRVEGRRFRVGVDQRLEVAALDGGARVLNAAGSVLASIPAGRNMSFALYQGNTVTVAGCLLYKDGGFILPVDDSAEVNQLNGPDLAANVGNRVEAMGTVANTAPSITPATRVINVTSIAPQSPGGCLTAAAALNAQASMPVNAPPVSAAQPNPGGRVSQSPVPVRSGGGMSGGQVAALVLLVGGGGAGAAFFLANKKSSTSP